MGLLEASSDSEGLHQSILQASRNRGWQLLNLAFCGGQVPPGVRPAGAFVDCLPDSILAQELRDLQCPAVRLGWQTHPQDDLLPAVLPALTTCGAMAAEHFHERGFISVGYVGHDPWAGAREMYDGFRERAAALGCDCHLLQFAARSGSDRESLQARYLTRVAQLTDWLAERPRPIALLTYNDRMAGQLCSMARACGFAVPEDVAILGCRNDSFYCHTAPVELSSLDLHDENRGMVAVELLEQMIRGEKPAASATFVPPAGIVERHSTDVLAVSDPRVARAIRFIWDHMEESIQVADVERAIGVNRRTLERAFRRQIGRGINEELNRKRLERFCHLLRSTDATIAELAETVGFSSAIRLHAVFREAFDMTPRQYRLRHGHVGDSQTPKMAQ